MTLNQSNILVTGGTGLLGQAIVRSLVSFGHSVRILSRNYNSLKHSQASIFSGDITCLKDVKLALQGCSAVFHCAAEKSNPKKMKGVNELGTKLLLDVATDLQVNFFCHLSSVGVIGRTNQKVVDELTPCNPMNLYEETKYAAEKIVSHGIEGGRVVILRPTNIFDVETVRQWMDVSLNSKMRLFLKGNENTHLVYMKDVSAAAIYLFEHLTHKPIDTFIVSSDEESGNTYNDVQSYLASKIKTLSYPFPISAPLFIPYFVRLIKNKSTNRGNIIYSSQKIRSIGFRFPYGLHKGLEDTINKNIS